MICGTHVRKGCSDPPDPSPAGIRRCYSPGGVLAEKLGRGVRPASQNPYPIYDQNLRFFLPYLWPNQKFDTLFMTWGPFLESPDN